MINLPVPDSSRSISDIVDEELVKPLYFERDDINYVKINTGKLFKKGKEMTLIEQVNHLRKIEKKLFKIEARDKIIIERIDNALIKCEGKMALIHSEFF